MKYLTVIWAFVMLAMACLPCTDEGTALAQSEVTTVQANDLHQDGAQGEDLCSPLCECNCCGGIKVAFHAPQLPELHELQYIPSLSTYLEPGAVTPAFPFWHPPQV
mgnify:CR=1 FL=1